MVAATVLVLKRKGMLWELRWVAAARPARPAPMMMRMREAVKEMKFLRLKMREAVKERESERERESFFILF